MAIRPSIFNTQKQLPRGVPEKGVPKTSSKFTGKHPCRSAISIKLLCNFIKITLGHGCSPVNLLHIFRTPFLKNSSGWLLLNTLLIVTYSISCLKGRIAPYALNIFSNFCKVQENVPFCILPENGVL